MIEKLQLKLTTLQTLPGVLQQSTLELFTITNNVNENYIPQFGRRTCQAVESNVEGVNYFKSIVLTIKSKETKTIVEYHEAFIYDTKHNPFNSLTEKRILAVSSFSDALADTFTEFSDETSVFKNLS